MKTTTILLILLFAGLLVQAQNADTLSPSVPPYLLRQYNKPHISEYLRMPATTRVMTISQKQNGYVNAFDLNDKGEVVDLRMTNFTAVRTSDNQIQFGSGDFETRDSFAPYGKSSPMNVIATGLLNTLVIKRIKIRY